mmetsp:Transcript_34356/g.94667  ORF Transcript_34356/g.94667 Transcript_34356/m.94667 type:complete len:201 (+) Transcript_34356:114-716(+)
MRAPARSWKSLARLEGDSQHLARAAHRLEMAHLAAEVARLLLHRAILLLVVGAPAAEALPGLAPASAAIALATALATLVAGGSNAHGLQVAHRAAKVARLALRRAVSPFMSGAPTAKTLLCRGVAAIAPGRRPFATRLAAAHYLALGFQVPPLAAHVTRLLNHRAFCLFVLGGTTAHTRRRARAIFGDVPPATAVVTNLP